GPSKREPVSPRELPNGTSRRAIPGSHTRADQMGSANAADALPLLPQSAWLLRGLRAGRDRAAAHAHSDQSPGVGHPVCGPVARALGHAGAGRRNAPVPERNGLAYGPAVRPRDLPLRPPGRGAGPDLTDPGGAVSGRRHCPGRGRGLPGSAPA
nr:hypothetical protein [Tanacetum cinerariifolium]